MRTSLAASGSILQQAPRAAASMAAAPMVVRAVQQEGTSMQVSDER